MDELKPCPFCGNKQIDCYADIHRDWYCECDTCGVELYGASEEEVRIKWNTRPIEDKLNEEIETWKALHMGDDE
jgi:hypothetical protein